MKYQKMALAIALVALGSTALLAQEGINFEGRSEWKAVLAKAAEQNQLVFVDAYTTWCGPCKKMVREVFPEKKVASFYNKNFINYQIDMEKGEGPQLAKEYNVFVYPTLLFVDGQGNLVHRSAGYHDVEEFITLGSTALDPSRRMSNLEARFAEGNRDPEFLRSFTELRASAFDGSHVPVAEAYMDTQKEWNTNDNRAFIFQYIEGTDNRFFDHLVDHREDYIAQFGQNEVTAKIQKLIYESLNDSKESSSLEQIDALFKKAYPEKAKQLSANFRMSYYRQAGDRENFAKAAVRYYKKYSSDDPGELNDIAWTFYTVINNKKQLKRAVKWAKKSIKMDPGLYNHDTLAALYMKLGKKKKAIKAAKKAIDLGRAKGEDYSETQKMLDELYKM